MQTIIGNQLVQGILLINLIKYLLYLYVDLRQKKCYEIKEIPKYILEAYKDCGEVSNEEFKKSQSYNNSKMVFGLINRAVTFVINWVFVFYIIYPLMWEFIYTRISSNEYISSLLFCGAMMLLDYPISLAFDLYYTFVLEEKYGFNNSTLKIFIMDQIKSGLLVSLFGTILLSVMIYIANNTGKYFYVYIALVQFAFIFIISIIYPIIIVPIFNKLTPVENQELAEKINKLCKDINFPLKNLYQMDASLRSNHGNAFFSGAFKSKSIILYDTILDFPQDEIIAIIGHEIGHWKNWDNYKLLFFSFIQTFVTLFIFHLTFSWNELYLSFGFSLDPKLGGRNLILSLLVFSYVLGPFSSIVGILHSIMSQNAEYNADEFSFKLGFGDFLASSLFRLSKKSSSCMIFDPIYSFIHLSHPTVCDRIVNLKKLKDKKN
ncbi:peptidase family M48 domain-containing [Cryptosporidium sp. chipmunk genotype I]|uniref:peptidase family M48 domain-containing n=1 Tax=Cryptosporidium sp. chipmunk genotype I TaxID=1280935 RepID=UPI00351A93E5|nr:peptidase family M48 domain-containing [Cryptosporidium sp. chipmunk genotype I]